MKRNNPSQHHKNQNEQTSARAKKTTFAEKPEYTDDDTRTHPSATGSASNRSNTSTNNQHQTHKQKKQKQHNTHTNNHNNCNTTKDMTKVTSYFVSGPARSKERVKNSRASQLQHSTGRVTRKGATRDVTFNYKHRYDVSVTLHATNLEERLTELQKNIDELMTIITDEDKNAKLLPWKDSKQSRHPAITSSEDSTGSFADIYLSRSWLGNIEAKHRLYMKLHIGHDKSYVDHILPALEDWNSHSDRQFKYCMLQAEETTFIGWLLYSTLSIDAGALADAIYDEYKVEVGLRWMDVRMSTQNNQSKKSKPVKALHVETSKAKGRSIMEILMRCYGRSFESSRNFPNGIRLRFCKNIDNAAYKMEKTKLINLRSRQKQLLAETNRTTSAGILDLEVIVDTTVTVNEDTSTTTTVETSLRDAIMAIKSKYVKDTPLFRSVDLSYNSEEYVFAYHQTMADEAKAMVDYLYPYLLHIYDKKSLKKAFDAEYIKEMISFKYNKVTDEVEDTIAESSYAMMEDDKLIGNQGFMEFDLSAMSIDDDIERPQASILGKMYSGQDSISTQHHAGKTRKTQATTEDILEITPDELRELQQAMLINTQSKNKTSARKNVLHINNFDTNTILQQIRARKRNDNSKGDNRETNEDSDSLTGTHNEIMTDNEEDEVFHETDEQEQQEASEEEDSNDISMNSDELSIQDEVLQGTEDIQEAKNHEQNSQPAAIGNKPPPSSRRGGKD